MKIFIAGPRAISKLDRAVEEKLHNIYKRNYTVLVGDADGVDRKVQEYFANLNYPNVIVYASNGKVRNNSGNWQVKPVSVPEKVKGFNFYAAKDNAMASDAEYGFMIWNGESKGTLNNVINLLNGSKEIQMFFTPNNSLILINSFERLKTLLQSCNEHTKKVYAKLNPKKSSMQTIMQTQLSLF